MDDDFTDWLVNREECIMDLDEEELRATRKLNGANELTADEMFKRLGHDINIFEKQQRQEEDPEAIPARFEKIPCVYTTKITRIIEYSAGKTIFNRPLKIIFWYNYEQVTVELEGNADEHLSRPITMQELKAINKKCKELGWIDE